MASRGVAHEDVAFEALASEGIASRGSFSGGDAARGYLSRDNLRREGSSRDEQENASIVDGGVEAGSRACLVIGESGANWSAGIATARRHGPNLALVTQWVGEAPRHFCQRVISRLSKRPSFAAIVMVCNHRNDIGAAEARQMIIAASAGAMCERSDRELTLICAPTLAGGIPHWAPQLAEYLPREDRSFGLTVELGAS
jgi:hypothetical protein